MKYLIVNGDDFGAGRGINRAIFELYELGALTSASLMVMMPGAADAVNLAKGAPGLGVGLHVQLTREDGGELFDFDNVEQRAVAIQAQIDAFCEKLGRLPTHIDSHQNVHRDARLGPVFAEFADRYSLPLREHSHVRYFSRFYGQWDGVSHPEHISVDNLLRMLESELGDRVTELSCHPGYSQPDFVSPYDRERESELRTLSNPRFREFLHAQSVQLINFRDVQTLKIGVPGGA